MTPNRHTRYHWITIAAVAAAAVLATPFAWGQTTGAAAVFDGRPAMAGPQAGQGALAGPPQGGIGVQGMEGPRGLDLPLPRPGGPGGPGGMGSVPRDPGLDRPPTPGDMAPQRDRDGANVDKRSRDVGRTSGRGVERALKRTKPGSPVDN